ncbi:MAG: MBL fold metallo-hydrolase [Candidatus Poribacteria bacterium]|nr:MBL fold metallo-hydrolase [Candidatus Poribacteria bacterium]
MATIVHFIDVGQGNMVLIEAASGRCFVFDCNITYDNEDRVLDYVADQIGEGKSLHAFICSHRDADHIRGVKRLNARFPIREVWDSDYPGTTTDSSEYRAYMELRRQVGSRTIRKRTRYDYGRTRMRMMSAKDSRLSKNANAQGIVIKVEQRNQAMNRIEGSAMLPGDSDAETWRKGILADYSKSDISSSILMAAHHGSISFFDDPEDRYYYTAHLAAIKPAMTVISVGPNSHGHPDSQALKFYRQYSTGSNKGNKVFRTDTKGTMKLTLKSGGGWNLSTP